MRPAAVGPLQVGAPLRGYHSFHSFTGGAQPVATTMAKTDWALFGSYVFTNSCDYSTPSQLEPPGGPPMASRREVLYSLPRTFQQQIEGRKGEERPKHHTHKKSSSGQTRHSVSRSAGQQTALRQSHPPSQARRRDLVYRGSGCVCAHAPIRSGTTLRPELFY